ncbi:MAG: HAMP domain-containing histidine kinase [Gemmatimonadetes bacterium]|nr:HAMP domain-containing histidine kinase [Gemmatimonadota bacterium]
MRPAAPHPGDASLAPRGAWSTSMTLRLRLALCYGGLTGIALALACAYSFAVHSRTHYDQLDDALRSAAGHIGGELARAANRAQQDDVLVAASHLGVSAQLLRRNGGALELVPGPGATARDMPRVNPASLLQAPSEPAYPIIAALAPAEHPLTGEPFRLGIIAAITPRGNADAFRASPSRWRVLVDAPRADRPGLVIMSPLSQRDGSVRAFGRAMLATAVIGTLVTFLLGWTIAGRALRPVAALTDVAAEIATSRLLHRRVPSALRSTQRVAPGSRAARPPHGRPADGLVADSTFVGDELERLADTMNRMLDSLQEAHAAQERFVADASHELRAPLSAVAGNLELLGRHLNDEERTLALDEAGQATHRLGKLVADLLALARTDAAAAPAVQQLSLAGVVQGAVHDARTLAAGRSVETIVRSDAQVSGDHDELVRLVLILLDNALKFSPTEAPVTLTVEAGPGRVDLVVTDAGPGIPPEALPFVFDRFFRADTSRSPSRGGTGLGLSIAKRIVERHGATIRIGNLPRRGVQVVVSFPLAGVVRAHDARPVPFAMAAADRDRPPSA